MGFFYIELSIVCFATFGVQNLPARRRKTEKKQRNYIDLILLLQMPRVNRDMCRQFILKSFVCDTFVNFK
jgi:hypothetical protein